MSNYHPQCDEVYDIEAEEKITASMLDYQAEQCREYLLAANENFNKDVVFYKQRIEALSQDDLLFISAYHSLMCKQCRFEQELMLYEAEDRNSILL